MPDENKPNSEQTTQNTGFDFESFNFLTNEDTGELEVKAIEPPKKDETVVDQNTPETPDRFSTLESNFTNQISGLYDVINKQSEAIRLLLQNAAAAKEPPDADLGEENNQLVDQITKKVVNPITQQFGQLQQQVNPLIVQQQIDTQIKQFAAQVPDAVEYFAGMQYIAQQMSDGHNWTLPQLYMLAKGMGLKANQPNNNNQQNKNVTDINTKRELPNKIESNNTQLKSTEIPSGRKGLKAAMEAAMEELGYGT